MNDAKQLMLKELRYQLSKLKDRAESLVLSAPS